MILPQVIAWNIWHGVESTESRQPRGLQICSSAHRSVRAQSHPQSSAGARPGMWHYSEDAVLILIFSGVSVSPRWIGYPVSVSVDKISERTKTLSLIMYRGYVSSLVSVVLYILCMCWMKSIYVRIWNLYRSISNIRYIIKIKTAHFLCIFIQGIVLEQIV